jgi:CBS domain-containing protein
MKISKIMTKTVKTVDYYQRADVALKMMEDHHFRHLVVTKAGHPYTIVSNRDLLVGAYLSMTSSPGLSQTSITVGQLATREPVMVGPEMTLIEAAKIILDKKISAFPVIEDGELLGIVTTHDIIRAFVEQKTVYH